MSWCQKKWNSNDLVQHICTLQKETMVAHTHRCSCSESLPASVPERAAAQTLNEALKEEKQRLALRAALQAEQAES